MRMLKGDSNALNFDQLMAQATQVAKQQDASLMERARQKRREDEERRRREERVQRERGQAQAQLNKKRELQEKQRKTTMKQPLDKKRSSSTSTPTKSSRSAASISSTKSSSVKKSAVSFLPEKKKPVHMSFEDLMRKAKEQSMSKGGNTAPKAPLPPKKYISHDVKSDNNTPTLYHRIKRPEATKSSPTVSGSGDSLSARERAKMLISEPPKKLNVQKRDRRTIDDIQREIRHNKGIHSDDEEDRRKDPRLMSGKRPQQSSSRYPPPPPLPSSSRKKPMSPPPRPGKRLPSNQMGINGSSSKRPGNVPPPPIRRMPFSGKLLDPAARRPIPGRNRRPRDEEEEEDEELREFIVDDDDEDSYGGGYRAPRKNSYSDEISKIFRYDKSRYANDPVYSDDDMEADASDVLREEKRSERLARQEDLLEEQKELERLKRRKKANA